MYSEGLINALKEFGVDIDPTRPAEVRDRIIARIAALHPDKTGGTFADSEQEGKYHTIKQLLERFERETSAASQMIPLHQVTMLIELLAKAQAPTSKEPVKVQIQATEQYKIHLKRKYAFPKITSALVASLCLALISLLGNFKSNPMYKSVVLLVASDSQVTMANRLDVDAQRISRDWYRISRRAVRFQELRGVIDFGALPVDELPDPDILAKGVGDEELITAGDLDLYTTDEPHFVKVYAQRAARLATEVAALQKQASEDKPAAKNTSSSDAKENYANRVKELTELRGSIISFEERIKTIGVALGLTKKKIVDTAEGRITWYLAIILILTASLFGLLWLRERSDARWVDFISSDEGLETVFGRLCARKDVASRTPPMFTLLEMVSEVRQKDVPTGLRWALGGRIDSKELGQITAQLIERLKERRVIAQSARPAVQTWYEIKVTVDQPVIDKPENADQAASVNLADTQALKVDQT